MEYYYTKLNLKIKPNKSSKRKRIIAWIVKKSDLDENFQQFIQVFEESIKVAKINKFLKFNIVKSTNFAIILNIFSLIQ